MVGNDIKIMTTKTEKFILTDTFNQKQLSSHRTVRAALAARHRHSRMVERSHGKGAYLHYSITSSAGRDITDDIMDAEWALCCE